MEQLLSLDDFHNLYLLYFIYTELTLYFFLKNDRNKIFKKKLNLERNYTMGGKIELSKA